MSQWEITVTVAAITDQGLVRTNNEDSYMIAVPNTGEELPSEAVFNSSIEGLRLIAIVSDGMGGAEGGEVASALTVETIRDILPRLAQRLSPQSRLEAAFEEANRTVWKRRKSDPFLKSMGATSTAALIEGTSAYIAEVGDSRAYIIRENRIKLLTKDQTFVQAMVDVGVLTDEQAERHHRRNVILQAIGAQEYLQVAVTSIDLRADDVLLLCSDGLSGKVKPLEMHSIVEQSATLNAAAQNMVELAKERGGDDNITVVLLRFQGEGLPQTQESLTTTIQIHSSFDPERRSQPSRRVRLATYEDWEASAVIEHFAVTPEQREAVKKLDDYGEFISFSKGDRLVMQGARGTDSAYHYWLISGRYRVEAEREGVRENLAVLVSPTDMRSEEEISYEFGPIRVKRQFFTASLAMISRNERNATIWCEDDLNCAIKISRDLFNKVAEILGERFLNVVRYS